MMAMKCTDCGNELMEDEIYVCATCDQRHLRHIDETCGTEFEIIEAVRGEDEINV